MDDHRFIVTGLDGDGDRRTFETNDPGRAEAMLNQFCKPEPPHRPVVRHKPMEKLE